MQVIYAGEQAPDSFAKSVFLAGPTPRHSVGLTVSDSWRPKMLEALEKAGYDGVVFVPESRAGVWQTDYMGQIEWEQSSMNMSDIVLMWVPRQMPNMVGLTTNTEFGMLVNSGKLLYGRPHDAPHTAYLDYMYTKATHQHPHNSTFIADEAARMLAEGCYRTGGERCIPRHIWTTKHFQDWYNQLRSAGNRLDDAKLLWNFILKNGVPFCFSLWVKVWVEKEQRHKSNEIIVSRTDISSICAYYKVIKASTEESEHWLDTEVLLVKEFRSPNRTTDGFVHELPGGSSFGDHNPCEVAASEFEEETGIAVTPNRIKEVSTRQLAGTFSTHKASLFALELTDMEIEHAEENAQLGTVYGNNVTDSEQTYLEVKTVREILDNNLVDWTTIGMIMQVVK